MREALKEAGKAYSYDEVPIGAVVVKDGVIIGRGRNRKEELMQAYSHAEVEAIKNACSVMNNWRLTGCEIFVTLEPCMMCLGTILESRISRVVYGAEDQRFGFCRYFLENAPPYPNRTVITAGVLGETCSRLMKDFFKQRREGLINRKHEEVKGVVF